MGKFVPSAGRKILVIIKNCDLLLIWDILILYGGQQFNGKNFTGMVSNKKLC